MWACGPLRNLHTEVCAVEGEGKVATWTVIAVLGLALRDDEGLRRGIDAARREVADWLLLRHDALLDRVTAPRTR